MIRPPPDSTLFPYTTLFRSLQIRLPRVFHQPAGVLRVVRVDFHLAVERPADQLQLAVQLGRQGDALVELHHRSEEHTSELQSRQYLVCRLLLEKKKHSHSR